MSCNLGSVPLNRFNLSGKVALVPGGQGKFGRYITSALAEAGAYVVVLGRSRDTAGAYPESGLKGNITYRQCDCRSEDQVANICSEFGPDLKILVNATSFRQTVALDASSLEAFSQTISANAEILYNTNVVVANHMEANSGGSVVNFSSIYAVNGADNRIYDGLSMGTEPDYPFIKAGVIGFTRYMATQKAKSNIRFNTIIAGGLKNDQPADFINRYEAKVPLGRMMTGDDLGGAVIFLVSDASSYMTGSELYLDGGFSSW